MLKEKDSKQSIQVTIRVRPLSQKELADDPRTCVRLEEGHSLQLTSAGETKKFTFDSICFNESQQELFDRVGRKCTLDCLEGYNCTVFAYGQTGAGKTYTMMGLSFQHERYYEHRGLLPRTLEFLFACIDKQRAEGVSFLIKCSFLEIYNEQIVDLLNKGNFNLQLREDTRKGVYVEGITEQTVTRSEEAMDILAKGAKSRHVGSTFYNEASSRSHSVFTMQIESRYSKNGVINTKSRQFNFIDLAGSQRTKQSTGERLKEGCNINKSLMNLAAVINALSQVSEGKAQHINYRNSKLTFLLKDSLGGNSRTNLIANISPAAIFYQETLSTLGFARRAKLIKREKASINEDSSGNLDSMKNEIKRLKQEVITLMGRLQSGTGQETTTEAQPSQMTSIMHQYVSEEIDKQTRLEVEILKLTERVGHLQTGVKQYSTNEVHLRMIIAVLEDKLQRLKQTEKLLAEQVDQLNLSDEQSKAVIEYFRNERMNMLKEMDVLKKQAEGGRFLRELLKQAKIVREEGEDDSLKELLSRNTAFLTAIHSRLNDIRPDRVQVDLSSEFQRKAADMANEFAKKEEQYGQRVEQLNLELNEYRSRNEDSEKLLEEAVGVQISLEERARAAQDAADKLTIQLNQSQSQVTSLKEEIQITKAKGEEAVAQVKSELTNSQSQASLLRKELVLLQSKLEKSLKNEAILKEEFASLEEEKYKLEKQQMQQIEDMREQKNLLIKYESEITLLQQRTDSAVADTVQIQHQLQQAHDQANEERKQHKAKLEEINQNMQKNMEEINSQKELLSTELEKQTKEVERLLNSLLVATQVSEVKSQQWKQIEAELQQELKSKEEKMNELLSLINEKELNGNETAQQLSQIKLELIDAHTEREATENKLRKQMEEIKDKLTKERTSYEQLEGQALERAKQLDKLTLQYQTRKKENQEQAEQAAKVTTQLQTLKADYESVTDKLQQMSAEIESMRSKEKEGKLAVMEAKNELFVAIKNAEIEVDAMRSQIHLKDAQIEQLEKEQSKNKAKFEKQVCELERELSKNRQMFEAHEENMRKSTQTHLMAKEKKIADIRTALQQKEEQLKASAITQDQLTTELATAKQTIAVLQVQLEQNGNRVKELEDKVGELTADLSELEQKMGKELQQAQIVHGEQIDQKNEQIEMYTLENEELQKQISLIKAEKVEIEMKKVELEQSLAVSQKQQSDLYIRNTQLLSELQAKQEEIKQIKTNFCQAELEMNTSNAQLEQHITQLTMSYQQQQSINQETNEKMKQLEQDFSHVQAQMAEANKELADKTEKISSITQSFNQQAEELALKTIESAQLSQQLSKAQHQIDELTNQLHTFKAQMQLRERSIEQTSEIVAQITVEKQQLEDTSKQQIQQLTNGISSLQSRIEELQQQETADKMRLTQLSQLTDELTKSLSSQRLAAEHMLATHHTLNDKITLLTHHNQQMASTNHKLTADLHHFEKELKDKAELLRGQELQLSRMGKLMEMERDIRERFEENGERMKKEADKAAARLASLTDQHKSMTGELLILGKTIKEIDIERSALKEKLANYEQMLQKTSAELSELSDYRRKWELQNSEMEQLRSRLEQESLGRERINGEMVRQRENNSSLRQILENSEAQVRQLEVELEEKDSIYRKLLEKIAKNEGESKRVTTSDHYLKTIELLEKTRAESLELRRQNEELRKGAGSLRDALEEKEGLVREVERKAEAYSVSMHKQMESIQAEYMEYEKIKDRLVREKKATEKLTHENDSLKEEIKLMKHNAAKLLQKHEETEGRLKKSHLEYIQLEKDYEELKKGQLLPNPTDDKTAYINRLKAEVAALKTEKVLLSDSLSKQRQEKTKLKAQMRYGKEGGEGGAKMELEKKINENKNLQELIFEIISQLKICVVEPKTKLEAIRSVILGTIKEKNNEIRTLKDKLKEMEQDHLRQPTREFKTLSISNGRNLPEEGRFDKEKDPAMLSTNSRQKMKEFENYYARFRQAEDRTRP